MAFGDTLQGMHKRHFRTEVGALFSEGSRRLWVIVEASDWDRSAVAKRIGQPTSMLSHWLYGNRAPGRKSALRIRDELGIPMDAWDSPPKSKFVLPALREVPPAALSSQRPLAKTRTSKRRAAAS